MKECCKAYLDEQFGGDADIVNEIYAEYVASIREKIAEAEAALSSGDKETAQVAIEMRSAATLADAALAASLLEKIKKLAEEL